MVVVELSFGEDERRLAARSAHRERLQQLQADGVLVLAGPWRDESGAMLVYRCDRAGLDEIMGADPYFTTPGVTVSAIREWNPISGQALER